MTTLSRIALLALLLVSAPAYGGEVEILTTFPGASGPGPKDCPDNAGAVGPDHVVDFTNANVVIHDKRTGKVVRQMTQTEFWKAANPGFDLPRLNDPRLLYDPLSGRWFGVIAELKKGSVGYLAVSETSDPTKGWRGVVLPMAPTDPGMKLGVDKNGLYIAYYVLTGNIHTMMSVHAIPKADAVAAGGPSLAHLQTFANLEIECFPATDLDPDKPADAPEVLLNREFGNSFSKLHLYKITWAGNTASISKLQTIPLSKTYQSPNGASLKNRASPTRSGGQAACRRGPAHHVRLRAQGEPLRVQRGEASDRLSSGHLLVRGPGQRWCAVAGRLRRRPGVRLPHPHAGGRRQRQRRSRLHKDIGEGIPLGGRHDARGRRSQEHDAPAGPRRTRYDRLRIQP